MTEPTLIVVDGEILEEEWAEVRNFPNYIVSNYGRVVSTRLDREICQTINWRGYCVVALSEKGVRASKVVHRLVAERFVPGWDFGLVVNHLDGVKINNVETNLEWCTQSENRIHALQTGLSRKAFKPIKIVETGEIFESIDACAKSLKSRPNAISVVLKGLRPRHKGFTFEYL